MTLPKEPEPFLADFLKPDVPAQPAQTAQPAQPKPAAVPASQKKEGDSVARIAELYDLMLEQNLDELELKNRDFHVKLRRGVKKPAEMPLILKDIAGSVMNAAAPAADQGPKGTPVKSPLNGIFYRAASPASAPFVKEGDTVEQGAVMCIVEAMKVMNEIRADKRFRVAKILVENGKPVSMDQDIFLVEVP